MKKIEIEAYEFDELKGNAREKALNTLQEFQTSDHWYEYTINDWTTDLNDFGFTAPNIEFSGFYSQGDGASFTCKSIDFEKLLQHIDLPKSIAHHKKLLTQILHGYINRTSHHYSHARTVSLQVGYDPYPPCRKPRLKRLNHAIDHLYDVMEEFRLSLCRKIYAALEAEYTYLVGEEAIKEMAEANEYMFDVNGRLI